MNIVWNELDVWNDVNQEFDIHNRKYVHKLLNAHYYFKFLDKMYYYMMIMNYYFGKEKFIISQTPEELIINKAKWYSIMENRSFRCDVVYNTFIACFYRRAFFPEEIFFMRNPLKWLFFKPLVFALDSLQKIITNRITFAYFDKYTSVVVQTNIFFGIVYEQTEGVKKKVNLIVENYQRKYLAHLPPGTLSRLFPGVEELQKQVLTDKTGRLINPSTTQ